MATTGKNDARIAGEGYLAGGDYGAITINGAGKVGGDVVASNIRINGAGTADGNVKADTIVVNGSASFTHQVQANEFSVNGDASVAEGVGVSVLKVKGRIYVGGGIAAHQVDARGEITILADCAADTFIGEGAISVGGMLNAETIDIKLHGKSKAAEIGGERVTIKQGKGWASMFSFFSERRLTTNAIEADDVSLEYVTAKVVRGARIEIGEGCNIELVEYSEDLKQAAGAIVGRAVKTVAG